MAIAIPLAAPTAQAYPICKADYQCIVTYYSNAQYTTEVGETFHYCDGTVTREGEITSFALVNQVECTYPEPTLIP